MANPLTARMAQALRDGLPRAVFALVQHPSGNAYFWSGIGNRTWNGQTWTGAGQLGTITPIKRSSEIAVQDIVFRISGVDATAVAGLSDNVHNLAGQAWIACLDDQGNVVADPYQVVDSVLDFQTMDVDDQSMTVTISITAHTGFYTLDRAIDEAWTPENQHFLYSGDIGLDQIPVLQNQDLQWTPS